MQVIWIYLNAHLWSGLSQADREGTAAEMTDQQEAEELEKEELGFSQFCLLSFGTSSAGSKLFKSLSLSNNYHGLD